MYNNYTDMPEGSYGMGRNYVEIKTEYDCENYSAHLNSNVSVLKLLQDQNDAVYVG